MTEQQRKAALAHYDGAKPKFVKGVYGVKYDYWKCGNCGTTLKHDVLENYCFNCGFRVLWDNPRCLTGYHDEEQPKEKDIKQKEIKKKEIDGQITLSQLIS